VRRMGIPPESLEHHGWLDPVVRPTQGAAPGEDKA